MMLEDYRELMRFHILFTKHNIGRFTHAAVDYNGKLFVYDDEPYIEYDDDEWLAENYQLITTLEKCKFWEDTLIKL